MEPARLTNDQKALFGFGAAVVPAILGLAIPGGLVKDRVDLDPVDIFVATVPWTASIALIVWFLQAAPDDWNDLSKAAVAVAILGAGAAIGVELIPAQAVVTEQQADQIPFYILAEQQGATAKGGVTAAQNPKVTVVIVLLGIAVFLAFVYAILYGVALWFAGLVCGLYLGLLLHSSFTSTGPVANDQHESGL